MSAQGSGGTPPGGGGDPGALFGGLAALLKEAGGRGHPPVERWNPPYCGDIGMRIAGDGTWFYQGSPIGRKPMVKLFASVLRRDGDGRTYLVTPVEKVLVTVEDAPFMAVEMAVDGEGRETRLSFRTNVEDVVTAGPDHPIRFGVDPRSGGLKPYLLVRGRLEALLTRALYYDLVERAVVETRDGTETLGIWSDGTFFAMAAAGPFADLL
ncbi:MAG: DUF1285 domain-containing protein [Hyphomicrobiaceae bacterium]